MKERQTYYDSLKYVLILFVIAGHCIEKYIELNNFNKGLYYFIYLFHMPLFVFVSGFFQKKFDWSSCKKSCFNLLETYIIVQLIWFVINGNYSLFYLLKPSWTLWYLLSMIWWKILAIFLVPKIKGKYLLTISVIIALLWGFIPFNGDFLSISRTVVYFPFYLLGVYTTNTEVLKIRNMNRCISISIIGLALLFVNSNYVLEFPNFKQLLWGSKSYLSIDADITKVFIIKIILMMIAAVLSMAFINLIPDKRKWSELGKYTLLFYIYHIFFIKFFNLLIVSELVAIGGGAKMARNDNAFTFFYHNYLLSNNIK